MDSLKLLDFSSFIIFSDDPWSLLVSFCHLFKLPLVVQWCNVICEWPLMFKRVVKRVHHFSTLSFKHLGIRYLEGERLIINLTMTTVIFLISRWSVTFFNTVDKRSPSNMLKIAWLKHMFHFVVSSLIILAEGNICRVDFYDKSYKNLNRYVLCNSLIITYPCSS